MANSVDLVIGSEAIKQVENLIAKLNVADAELLKISQSATAASKGISGISTPSGLDKAVSNTSALNAQLEKQNAIITKLHADIAKKAEQSRLAEIKLQQQREKAFDSFEKNSQKEAAANDKAANAYNKTQTQINRLTSAYNDLAVRKERYNNLNANEEIRLQTLSRVNEKYNGILKITDATIGKNQRNVGNYASGYNALGNSINQLTREAPAFANSMNTGFMAISNNIPAFTDAIGNLKRANLDLIAQGKQPVSIMKQLASSFLSFNTLISVGVTLLTVFGAKLIEWAFNTDAVKKATDSLNESLKQNENQVKENIKQIEHQAAVDLELAKQRGASEKELAANRIKLGIDVLTEYEKNNARTIALLDSFDRYRLLQAQGGNKAFMFLLDKYHGDITAARKEFLRRESAYTDENRKILVENQKKTYELVRDANNKNTELDAQLRTEQQKRIDEANKKAIDDAAKAEEDRLKAIAELNKKELELQLANIDAKLNNEDSYYTDRLTALDADLLKRIEIANLDYEEEFRLAKGSQTKQKTALINFQLEKLALIQSYNKKKNELEALDLDPIAQLATPKGQEKDPFKSVIDSAKEAVKGLKPHTEALKKDWRETFDDIADQAQKAGDLIAEFSQRNFDNEYRRLEAQKDISLKFAGDSAESKAKIEEEYEKKRNEIANRENNAKKKQAIFNIAIDTAQALIKLWVNPGFPAAIPMAAIVGAMGLAQIALVSSQKVPQYFDGTGNHTGGLMLVNDGGGSNYQEKVILPSGKEIMPEGRNVLMNAPKGTKVLTHEQQIMQMLNERGVSMHANYSKNNGVTAQEIDSVMSKHFAKIQTNTTTIDKRGFRQWNEKNGNKTIQNNNRVSRTGFKI